LKLSMRFYVSS